ncbi:regulator of chromosome condensation 1/beta-lactamase-inhibitor protein II [Scenedesmus sp. NREL 46B-D3]|nr:regulator of chromosome condensation 1/beta-lactamase-inhibitor protein II [Scenedesmus sp. NREL 46B-D3]
MPPNQGSGGCAKCSSSGSSSTSRPAGPPGVVAAVSRLPVLQGRVVVSAAASLFNTALLTVDGELYMLGSNDSGLLGRRPKPADAASSRTGSSSSSSSSAGDAAAADFSWAAVRAEALEPHPLADVALGQEHALAVTQQGLLASWGANESGQLGLGTTSEQPQHNPKLLRGSAVSSALSKSAGAGSGAPSAATAAAQHVTDVSGSPATAGSGSSTARTAFVRCAVGASNSLALSSSGRAITACWVCRACAAAPPSCMCPACGRWGCCRLLLGRRTVQHSAQAAVLTRGAAASMAN